MAGPFIMIVASDNGFPSESKTFPDKDPFSEGCGNDNPDKHINNSTAEKTCVAFFFNVNSLSLAASAFLPGICPEEQMHHALCLTIGGNPGL